MENGRTKDANTKATMPWMIDDKRLIAADFVESSFT
jgi:hypothetical protein